MPEYVNGTCLECGANIQHIMRQTHDNFHAGIDELIEWAQSISAVMVPPTGEKIEGT